MTVLSKEKESIDIITNYDVIGGKSETIFHARNFSPTKVKESNFCSNKNCVSESNPYMLWQILFQNSPQ